jgi:hypothetical protein
VEEAEPEVPLSPTDQAIGEGIEDTAEEAREQVASEVEKMITRLNVREVRLDM